MTRYGDGLGLCVGSGRGFSLGNEDGDSDGEDEGDGDVAGEADGSAVAVGDVERSGFHPHHRWHSLAGWDSPQASVTG